MLKNLLTTLLFLPLAAFAQSPNFVFILADDMGWTGTSVQVSPTESGSVSDFYETPNLVTLASQGMTFSQAYAPAPKCSPTRCSILTGETTARNGFTETGNAPAVGEDLLNAPNINSIPDADITIAEWLATTGLNYRSAHYGKWHLGNGGPASNGFGYEDGNNTNTEGDAGDGQTIQTDPKKIMDLTTKGIGFMTEAVAANEPFYLQLSHYAVHTLVETTQASFDYYSAKTPGTIHDNVEYAGMTQDLDTAVGLILEAISNLSIEGNTYVIFMSDNGAQTNVSDNSPLVRGKSFIFEGGIRVPLIIKGPNIAAGSTCSEPVVGYDLFPTYADWTNSQAPLPNTLDGVSIAPLTLGNTISRDEPIYFHVPQYGNGAKVPTSAATKGNYKYKVNYETGEETLFDLSANINENQATNLLTSNPTLALEMKIHLRDYLKSVNANMPSLNPEIFTTGTATDLDNDGLVDEWEFRELLSYMYGPTDDPDGDGDNNLVEQTNATDPLVDETILAIDEIANFKAELQENNEVLISWENRDENEIDVYGIEHSMDKEIWVNLETVNSSITSFVHQSPENGINYYRLKTNRLNGLIDYSNIASVSIQSNAVLRLFPNPATNVINLEFRPSTPIDANITVEISSLNGQVLRTFNVKKATFLSFPLEGLSEGIYHAEIFEEGESISVERFFIE